MDKRKAFVIAVNGNIVTARCSTKVIQNEIAYVLLKEKKLKAEVIRIFKDNVILQVFEETRGIKVGDTVLFSEKLLSVQLGPGLLGQVFDGLQTPLSQIAKEFGNFMQRGISCSALKESATYYFEPLKNEGEQVCAGSFLGEVLEGTIKHKIMVPFYFKKKFQVKNIASAGDYKIKDEIVSLIDEEGECVGLSMMFEWPVKRAVRCYEERLLPTKAMITGTRVIDTFFPVALGGTYCIPGPFGAGKTVVQQITSRYAKVDIVVIVACGERAGEVVETMQEFPKLKDPQTGRSLMERTIIVCNTSAMPVASREASIYTGIAMAEYYRQMGLHVLVLADSTSRWAQAMREISGRLEEIPGEEAFPAYLESRIAAFYERAGLVNLVENSQGSITIGGTVSPAGGNFSEPVTQASLKVVGAFHGLSRERAEARRFPSIHPLESWSKYKGVIKKELVLQAMKILQKGNEIRQMISVLGEDSINIEDYLFYLKSELLDAVYLQQNSFNEIDSFSSKERQDFVFNFLIKQLSKPLKLSNKEEARSFFNQIRSLFLDWNYSSWKSEKFGKIEQKLKLLWKEQEKENA